MFSYLYQYYTNVIDTPSKIIRLNLWAYTNARLFKLKISHTLVYFISGLTNLKLKTILVTYRDWNFNNFYIAYLIAFIFFFFFITLILFI